MSIFSKIFDSFSQHNPEKAEFNAIVKQLNLHPHNMFMGTKVNPVILEDKLNIVPLGNTLWVGGAESGFSCVFYHALTHPQDLIILLNPKKQSESFKNLNTLNRVLPLFNGDVYSVEVLVDLLYLEVVARRENNYMCPHNIIVVLEEHDLINQALVSKEDNTFLKLKNLMAVGSRYGIYFHGFYQQVSELNSLPKSLENLYDYKNGFYLSDDDVKTLNFYINGLRPPPQPINYGYNQKLELLQFPFVSLFQGHSFDQEILAQELIAKKHSNVTPSGLLTLSADMLGKLKQANGLIFNRYSQFKNHKYLPEQYRHLIDTPVEDIAFWDFINQGPSILKK